MLIETYDLEVFSPPCDPGSERYAAKARLKVDISAYELQQCGEPTCYSFSLQLTASQKKLAALVLTWVEGQIGR